jgi:hypothetical protein
MKKLVALILAAALFTLFVTSNSHATDFSVSAEFDAAAGNTSPDFQATVGQTFADIYRVYVNAEHAKESSLFPNSDKNYRIGIEDNYFGAVKLETGVGCYHTTPFGFVKATFSYDTAAKK